MQFLIRHGILNLIGKFGLNLWASMTVSRQQFGIAAAALMLAFVAGQSADAGFVVADSPDVLVTASLGSSAREEGKSDFEPPEWIKQILLVTARKADASMEGTSTGTSSNSTTMSHAATLGGSLIPLTCGPGQQLVLDGCPTHVPPDLGGLSPPPRGC